MNSLDNSLSTNVIRPLEMIDLDQIFDIEQRAYPLPWTRSMIEKSLGKDDCLGLRFDGALVAYAFVSYVLDEAHLLNICVDPRHTRKGFGRGLLRFLIDRAIKRSVSTFFLEVRASNIQAIDLYFSEGFNEVGVRPNYYPASQGREDAVLMTLELSVEALV